MTAAAAFLEAKAQIDAMLATITEASEDYFGKDRVFWDATSADTLHWGHVGDLNRIAATLREAVAALPATTKEEA
jgi:hypothetical protein